MDLNLFKKSKKVGGVYSKLVVLSSVRRDFAVFLLIFDRRVTERLKI